MNIKLVKKEIKPCYNECKNCDPDKKCRKYNFPHCKEFYCDNLVEDQEYCFEMNEKVKKNSRVYFWKGEVGYYTDIIIKVSDDCLYSRTAKYKISGRTD